MVGISTVLVAGAAVITLYQIFGRSGDPGDASRRRVAVDSVSGEVFTDYPIHDGDSQPWKNPKSGERTLYPAEPCFWTRDGKAKLEPTYVLLNQYVGKPGQTICPDCGHVVVAHNPMPPMELIAAASKAKSSGSK